MALVRGWLRQSAHAWGISTRTAAVLFWLPLIATVLLLLLWLRREIFNFLVAEDGIVEWLTAAAFAGAAVFALNLARQQRRSWRRALAFLGLAAFLVFLTGEEISWGQRVFGIETPGALSEINRQQETNLHNIGDLLEWFRLAMLGVAVYGVFVPLLHGGRLWQRWSIVTRYLFVPPTFLISAFLVPLLFRLARLTVYIYGGEFKRFEEFTELCLAYAALAILWLLARRGRAPVINPMERAESPAAGRRIPSEGMD